MLHNYLFIASPLCEYARGVTNTKCDYNKTTLNFYDRNHLEKQYTANQHTITMFYSTLFCLCWITRWIIPIRRTVKLVMDISLINGDKNTLTDLAILPNLLVFLTKRKTNNVNYYTTITTIITKKTQKTTTTNLTNFGT